MADRYIERGGYVRGERAARAPEDLLALGSFLAWHAPDHAMGGVTAEEAWGALCRLLDLSPVEFRRAIMEPFPAPRDPSP